MSIVSFIAYQYLSCWWIIQIVDGPLQNLRVLVGCTQQVVVAVSADEPTHLPGSVVMVYG
jgi:hypothetical protein